MVATLTNAASEAWALLVHPDQVCTPLVAVDWLVEQTGEDTKKCVRALFNAAASWCEKVGFREGTANYEFWAVSYPYILAQLRKGNTTLNLVYGEKNKPVLQMMQEFNNYPTDTMYRVWQPFVRRVFKSVEILDAITNSI